MGTQGDYHQSHAGDAVNAVNAGNTSKAWIPDKGFATMAKADAQMTQLLPLPTSC